MPVMKKVTPVETVKRGRGRPKGSTNVNKSPWFVFVCPKCGAKYGAMMPDAEFSCYNKETKCNGVVAKRKGK